jgi:hypothetical protein
MELPAPFLTELTRAWEHLGEADAAFPDLEAATSLEDKVSALATVVAEQRAASRALARGLQALQSTAP